MESDKRYVLADERYCMCIQYGRKLSSAVEGFSRLLAMSWTGLAASSAAIARSGTGGIGAATPRRPVAKIALVPREAVGCRRPHWVFIEGAPGKARCV
jgi:hypothetical protein